MKIVYNHRVFWNQRYGGISRYHVRLAEELYTLGEDIRIIAPFHRNEFLKEAPGCIVKGKYLKKDPDKTKIFYEVYNRLFFENYIRIQRPDIVHETYYSPGLSAPRGMPIIITVHDMTHELFPEEFVENDKNSKNKCVTVNRADHIICISQNTKKDLIRLFNVPEQKISVVYNGYEYLDVSDQEGMLNFSFPYLLFVGSRYNYKNFDRLLEAYESSKLLKNDFKLIAFGGGDFTPSELHKIKEYGLTEKVMQVSGDDHLLGNLYKHASALIYPSLYEGFGMPPLEAMAQNCPVIASNTSSIPEVVGNAGELFDPLDIDSMRYSIEKVLYSDHLRDKLINLGHKQIKLFSWEKCAIETRKVYQKVIG